MPRSGPYFNPSPVRLFWVVDSDETFLFGHWLENAQPSRKQDSTFCLKAPFSATRIKNDHVPGWFAARLPSFRARFIPDRLPHRVSRRFLGECRMVCDPFTMIPVEYERGGKDLSWGVPIWVLAHLRNKFGSQWMFELMRF